MDHLFSPWRMQFIVENKQTPPDFCVLCDVQNTENDRGNLILHRGIACYVILNLFPYGTGHLMVVPHRHAGSLSELSPEESAEAMTLLTQAERVLRDEYHPQGFNIGANIGKVAGAGVPGHVHFHILPRWGGDTNFLPIFGRTKSIPEDLEQTYDRLKVAWPA